MKHKLITVNRNSRHVILFFAGWGMDASPFSKALGSLEKDCLIVYDYSDLDACFDISGYSGYYVVAWSFGVYAAAYWIASQKKKPLKAIAVNGTTSPVDDNLGIPRAIFDATLNALSEKSLMKFFRRMCGTTAKYERFVADRPQRDIESLRNELIAMRGMSDSRPEVFDRWDVAYISENDYIFPPTNQKRAWKNKARTVVLEKEYHLPDNFLSIINANIVNKALVKCRFEKSIGTYDNYAEGQARIARTLLEKWEKTGICKGKTIYEIGCGTGMFTKLYSKKFNPSKIILNDITEIPKNNFNGLAPKIELLTGDAETVFPEEQPFYIVSASTVQWLDDIPAFLSRIHSLLENGGYIAISTFGKHNYQETRSVFSSSLLYYGVDEWKEMLKNTEFVIDELSEDLFKIEFNSAKDLLKCLKHTGVNAITSPQKINKEKLERLQEQLPHENGKYALSYNPIYIIAHKI